MATKRKSQTPVARGAAATGRRARAVAKPARATNGGAERAARSPARAAPARRASQPAVARGRSAPRRASKAAIASRAGAIVELLQQTWGHAVCELDFQNPYQLLVATILSAQSTDRRVNMVTPSVFARYPSPAALAEADPAELERLIHSTGFFRNKARSLIGMARKVVADHGGEIPRSMEQMLGLPGVARKTANVVLGTAFGIPTGVVVDTHVARVTTRLGLTREEDPKRIEQDLMAVVPRERWIDFGHQVIWHGRRICHARKPECPACPLAPVCPSAMV
jgi:endonuclease-3